MVRRTTIRKRMRAKLRQIKPELRKRMHDPVPQTGQWLRSWTRMLTLAKRWLPHPAVLHPFPDARFAATHPR
jgi:hypothetical protein